MSPYNSFFNAYFAKCAEIFLPFCIEEYKVSEADYIQFVTTPVLLNTELFFKDIENRIDKAIPEEFKLFYSTCYTIDLDFQLATVFLALPNRESGNEKLEEYIFHNDYSAEILRLNLLPIGSVDIVYFICIEPGKTDGAIYLFDSERWRDPILAKSSRPWFSSFRKFILCLEDYLKTQDESRFSLIDPENNFENPFSTFNHFSFSPKE